jgi:hypothetical protein
MIANIRRCGGTGWISLKARDLIVLMERDYTYSGCDHIECQRLRDIHSMYPALALFVTVFRKALKNPCARCVLYPRIRGRANRALVFIKRGWVVRHVTKVVYTAFSAVAHILDDYINFDENAEGRHAVFDYFRGRARRLCALYRGNPKWFMTHGKDEIMRIISNAWPVRR